MIIGLTGQTGAGKTTAATCFVEQGIPVIDADKIAREIVKPGQPTLQKLVEEFSHHILLPDGQLNRAALAKIVFSDETALQRLNEITHPIIRRQIDILVEKYQKEGHTMVVVDAPQLFESGANQMCDRIVAVIASPEIRLERIMQRDGINQEMAQKRIAAQKSEAFFLVHSDYVLENRGNLRFLQWEVTSLIRLLKEIAGEQ